MLDIDAMKGTMFTDVKTVHHVAKSLAEVENTLKSAAVMGRRGSLEVDASIESRDARERRTAEAEASARLQHEELVQRMFPDDGKQSDDPDSRQSK